MNDKSQKETVYSNREARIRLTPKCNYRCFFCHEEGGCNAPVAEWQPLRRLLLGLKAQRRKEITFTGGEPLLNKPVLLKALEEISSWDNQPEVTLITNAVLLDESVIEALEKCNSAKVHVSIHDPLDAGYQLVTGQSTRTAIELEPILQRISSGKLRLKLNAVITENYFRDDRLLSAMLEYACRTGAGTVKFVELLETKDIRFWPLKKMSAGSMERKLLESGFIFLKRTCRTSYWRSSDGLTVEVTRCACAAGCERCDETRGDSFTGGTHYHPCFLDEKTILVEGRMLEHVLVEGDVFLKEFIAAKNVA